MKKQVFISYASKELDRAEEVCRYLEGKGVGCWIAPRDILPGTEYGEEIINGIENSEVLVLIYSDSSNKSQHVLREVERAVSKRVPIIAYKIENSKLTKSMEYFLLTNQWLDATDKEKHLAELYQSIMIIINGKEQTADETLKSNGAGETAGASWSNSGSEQTADGILKSNGAGETAGVLGKSNGHGNVGSSAGTVYENKKAEDHRQTRKKYPLLLACSAAIIVLAAVLIIVFKKPGSSLSESSEGQTEPAVNVKTAVNIDEEENKPEKQADEAEKQTDKPEEQTGEAEKQADKSEKQAGEAEKQTGEGEEQADKPEKQAGEAEKQADKPEKQAGEGEKQADKSGKQTDVAEKQADKPEKQADEGEKQEIYPEIGQFVNFGHYRTQNYNDENNDDSIKWIVVCVDRQNKQVVLLSEKILDMKPFDCAESGHFGEDKNGNEYDRTLKETYSQEQMKEFRGNSDWAASNIRTWLNSNAARVSYEDAAPSCSATDEYANDYEKQPGFLYNFTKDEIALLCEVENITPANLADAETMGIPSFEYESGLITDDFDISGYAAKTTKDRVYLLSADEVRKYLYENNMLIFAEPTKSAVESDDSSYYKAVQAYGTNCCSWVLRTPNGKLSESVLAVSAGVGSKDISSYLTSASGLGIRPTVTISLKNIELSGDGTEENPFVFK